jgi:hypothetical protein
MELDLAEQETRRQELLLTAGNDVFRRTLRDCNLQVGTVGSDGRNPPLSVCCLCG